MTNIYFQEPCQNKVKSLAFSELIQKQKSGSKWCEINYAEHLEMADFKNVTECLFYY